MAVAEEAADRLVRSISSRRRERMHTGEVPEVSAEQVALVLRALADHTLIMEALEHRPDPTSPWPHATSLGRWCHDVADEFEQRARS